MKTIVALGLAFATGLVSAPAPDPVVLPAAAEPRFLSKQEDDFLRLMCSDGGCTMIRNDQLNNLTKRAERCRA